MSKCHRNDIGFSPAAGEADDLPPSTLFMVYSISYTAAGSFSEFRVRNI